MVVTEKICNLFGRKKVKRNDMAMQSHNSEAGQMFGDCYMEFRRTVDLEKELEQKMSDVCLEDEADSQQTK